MELLDSDDQDQMIHRFAQEMDKQQREIHQAFRGLCIGSAILSICVLLFLELRGALVPSGNFACVDSRCGTPVDSYNSTSVDTCSSLDYKLIIGIFDFVSCSKDYSRGRRNLLNYSNVPSRTVAGELSNHIGCSMASE